MSIRTAVSYLVRLVTAAGLAVDAGIHIALAPTQPPGGPGQLSQVTLFYAEGIVAAAVTLLVLVAATRWVYLVAAVVAATALAAVLVSRFYDIGSVGPVPDLYEPVWYLSKVVTTIAESVATVSAVAGVVLAGARRRADVRALATSSA